MHQAQLVFAQLMRHLQRPAIGQRYRIGPAIGDVMQPSALTIGSQTAA
jgi:hypothetical protein